MTTATITRSDRTAALRQVQAVGADIAYLDDHLDHLQAELVHGVRPVRTVSADIAVMNAARARLARRYTRAIAMATLTSTTA